MGNLKDLVGMIPGVSGMLKDVEIDDDAFKPVEAIIKSMTPTDRATPANLDTRRRRRSAPRSGPTGQQVKTLIKQFDGMRKMMKQMNQMDTKQMMRQAQQMRKG